jgi:hypothetical protein
LLKEGRDLDAAEWAQLDVLKRTPVKARCAAFVPCLVRPARRRLSAAERGPRTPSQLLFTETDPTTLSYDDPSPALALVLVTSASQLLTSSALISTSAASPNQVTAGSNLTLIASKMDANQGIGSSQVAFHIHSEGTDMLLDNGNDLIAAEWVQLNGLTCLG